MNHDSLFARTVHAGVLTAVLAAANATAEDESPAVHYRTATVDGIEIFYREAGPPDAPAVLLLHGFPTSSHMYRNLIPRLADRYRVVAPDYPGFGYSAVPGRGAFDYTFERISQIVGKLTEQIGLERYALYVMDYGAPVGFRLASCHPERVTAIVVQNGNAYEEGLTPFWEPIKAYWRTGGAQEREALRPATQLESTRWQYVHGVADPSLVSPDAYTHDQQLLDRPGNAEIQLDLFYDYRRNVDLYPQWQADFREHRPPTLVIWGRNDEIFGVAGAAPYKHDNPDAELHLLNAGHFALESHGAEIAALMRDFLDRKVRR
jgi:pimeloyl-ACP methyl ester carboxylesterase